MFGRIQSDMQVCVGLTHCCMPNECAFLAWGCRVYRGLFNYAAPPLVNYVTSISPSNEVKLAVYSGRLGYTNNPSFIPLFFISLDWLDRDSDVVSRSFLMQSWYFRSLHAITFNCVLLHGYWLRVALSLVQFTRKRAVHASKSAGNDPWANLSPWKWLLSLMLHLRVRLSAHTKIAKWDVIWGQQGALIGIILDIVNFVLLTPGKASWGSLCFRREGSHFRLAIPPETIYHSHWGLLHPWDELLDVSRGTWPWSNPFCQVNFASLHHLSQMF